MSTMAFIKLHITIYLKVVVDKNILI